MEQLKVWVLVLKNNLLIIKIYIYIMIKISKRFSELKNIINKSPYTFNEALNLVFKTGTAHFDESIEVHISLNIETKNINKKLKNTIVLPHNLFKQPRICIFTEPEHESYFLNLGASKVGLDNILNLITNDTIDFDILITTPNLLPKLIKFHSILSVKNLMPSQTLGTVTTNLEEALLLHQKGQLTYKFDNTGNIHFKIGKCSSDLNMLKENLKVVLNSILKTKALSTKKTFINSFYICTTMGPSIQVDISTLNDFLKI